MEKIKSNSKVLIIEIIVYFIGLYFIPFILDLLIDYNNWWLGTLIIFNSNLVLITTILCQYKMKQSIINIIMPSLLFLPSIFILYNSSAWGYSIYYLILALIGSLVVYLTHKIEKKQVSNG